MATHRNISEGVNDDFFSYSLERDCEHSQSVTNPYLSQKFLFWSNVSQLIPTKIWLLNWLKCFYLVTGLSKMWQYSFQLHVDRPDVRTNFIINQNHMWWHFINQLFWRWLLI